MFNRCIDTVQCCNMNKTHTKIPKSSFGEMYMASSSADLIERLRAPDGEALAFGRKQALSCAVAELIFSGMSLSKRQKRKVVQMQIGFILLIFV